MKKKAMLNIALVIMIIFVCVSSYFWYKFFLDLGSDGSLIGAGGNRASLVLVAKNQVHTTYDEDDKNIEGYKFSVQNKGVSTAKYRLVLVELDPREVNDGCTESTMIDAKYLQFELYYNDKVMENGILTELNNGVLVEKNINIDTSDNYELKVWLSNSADDLEGKHYHYKVELEVIK